MSPLTDPLQQHVDRVDITELVHAYCAYCDQNDPDGVADCFTDDCLAFYGPGPAVRGKESRREVAARDLALFESTSHHLSNVVIDFVDIDHARVSSYIYAWHRPRVGGVDWELWGQYHDLVVRTDGRWLIAERTLLMAGTVGFPEEWTWLRIPRR